MDGWVRREMPHGPTALGKPCCIRSQKNRSVALSQGTDYSTDSSSGRRLEKAYTAERREGRWVGAARTPGKVLKVLQGAKG